ncbi:MAG: single-stranded DNA-binding protein [Catonella sp.]|uniref:single-stranded DNA-binding protein n=1 Tax=Catonella sp. TaxID=2382125 RepID=UPI003FA0C71A
MNKVILMGRLTRDPEMRYSQDMAIARFSLAIDRRFKKQGDTVTADFFNCTAFGKQGEFVEKYLKQGTKVLVTGRIQNDNYTNKDGQKVYSVQVIVEEIEFAESKNSSAGGAGYAPNMPSGEKIEPTAPGDDFMNINPKFDKDLPFGD